MDNTFNAALQWLISERAVTNQQDLDQATKAIQVAFEKFPKHYLEFPANESENIRKEIFKAQALATYLEGKVGRNELSLYQQDVVRKLTSLRRLELGRWGKN